MRAARLLVGLVVTAAAVTATATPATAAENCGNGVDDDGDGLADEGCMPSATTGVCESPLDCGLNGAVAPLTGALTYDLPAADLAPVVPYGPAISFHRFYTSKYEPGSGAPAYRQPLGERWQHGYMSWLDKDTSGSPTKVVLHTRRGQDVLFTYASTSGGYAYYSPQIGVHVIHLRQATSSPDQWELKDLDGNVLVYDFDKTSHSGKLIEIRDSLATPNVVAIAYDSNGQVSTVTDASGARRLLFGYTGGKLTTVAYQTVSGGTPTTRSTMTYAYTSGELTGTAIGGKDVHAYAYSGGLLTTIEDADGNDLATFAYEGSGGKVVRIDTGDGAIGYEYASARSSCSGKTVLYFNAPTTISCDDDSDCASVSTDLMCGGETDTGAANTGKCYYAGRCLTVSSPNEDLVTTVTAVAPSGGTCDGACTDVAEYGWNSSVATLKGVKDPGNYWTSYTYDSNGLPTLVVTGDSDDDATNSGGFKTWFFYGNSSFPGRVTEVRRASVGGGTCTATDASGCKRTRMTYNSDGLLASVQETGYTLNSTSSWITYDYTTTYTYDSAGRLTQVDGPLSGSNDLIEYEYWSSSNVLENGYLQKYRRKKNSSTSLLTEYLGYDAWGKPTSLAAPDGTLTCFTYGADQGFLAERREAMAGQTSCSASSADLVTTWEHDTTGRVRSIEGPGGDCTYYGYDSLGRLSTIKPRDDCSASSSGDTTTYTYGDGDRVTKIEVTDASSTVVRRQELGYYESRRLKTVKDPVSAQSATMTYDSRGLLTQEDAKGGLGKTVHVFDEQRRETELRRHTTSSDYDAWTLAYYYLFYRQPLTVTDEDSKAITTVYDDMNRRVRMVTPESATTVWAYDAAGRNTARNEAYGTLGSQLHAFTYDNADRPLAEDYLTSCGTGAPAEVEYVYDAPPVTCPSGASCLRTAGRLAYARVSLACNTSLSDKSFDQETFYSYDDAGRLIGEYIRDDGGRIDTQTYSWTKAGALASFTPPSGVALGATFGGSGNADANRVATLWRSSSSSPVIDNVTWFAGGGLKSYRHQNTIRSHQLQTVLSRDLAGRVTDVLVEDSVDGTDQFDVAITRDDKGRVTGRDYTGGHSGLQDSFYTYDWLDRIVCESTSASGSCPTSGSTLKNNISGTPPYTASGDRRELRHAIPGYSATLHEITLVSGTDKISYINQPSAYGQTDFGWNAKGDRVWETNYGYDVRGYGYDDRRNLVSVNGFFKPTSGSSWHTYWLTSFFDQRNRRVSKQLYDATAGTYAVWYFYYDPLDRLAEIKYWPDTSSSSTYSIFQISWLGSRAVAMFQTDYPGATLSRRYVHGDDGGRPLELYSWPSAGDAVRTWAINPDAWGNDVVLTGGGLFQPLVSIAKVRDDETVSWFGFGQVQRPALISMVGQSQYDPLVGLLIEAHRAGSGYEHQLENLGSASTDDVSAMTTIVVCWNTIHTQPSGNPTSNQTVEVLLWEELLCVGASGGGGRGGGGNGGRPDKNGDVRNYEPPRPVRPPAPPTTGNCVIQPGQIGNCGGYPPGYRCQQWRRIRSDFGCEPREYENCLPGELPDCSPDGQCDPPHFCEYCLLLSDQMDAVGCGRW